MPVAIGPRMLIDNIVADGVDPSILFQYSLEDGISTEALLQLVTTRVGETNIMLEQEFQGLVNFTERTHARYRNADGVRNITPYKTEFTRDRMKRAQKIGHMLPRHDFSDGIEYTKDYLRRGNREDVRDDIEEVVEAWEHRVRTDFWNRVLSNAEDNIGGSGFSPGWAIGSGTSLDYIPPIKGNWDPIDGTHTHYLKTNAAMNGTNTAAMLEKMAFELAHHGMRGRKVVYISQGDLSTYETLNGKKFAFNKPQQITLLNGGGDPISFVEGELEGVPGELFGYYQSNYGLLELRHISYIPKGYLWATKSHGNNHPSNPVAMRTEPNMGFGLKVDAEFSYGIVPRLKFLEFDATHGVGVNDRAAGVVGQIATGDDDYINPSFDD